MIILSQHRHTNENQIFFWFEGVYLLIFENNNNLNNSMLFLKWTKIVHPRVNLLSSHSQQFSKLRYLFSNEQKSKQNADSSRQQQQDEQLGTDYSNWVLARSAKFNHDVSYLKRRFGRDRYNIHKLTNIDFMRNLVNRDDKYTLNINQKIVLLAQMNHVCNVLKKDKGVYTEFTLLTNQVMKGIQDPDDYICAGTFMNVLVDLGDFSDNLWMVIMDALFVKKYDEEYDELFGLYSGLFKYKTSIEEISDYMQLQKNKVIYNIPIIYRNSLEVIRQYVKFNIYNLKQCRILFRGLYQCKITEKYFWNSVYNWFNIYIKEQLQKKDYQEFFIVSESAIDKILFDDGIIRPRSILEELADIAFILSQYGFISGRFISFIQNLILFSIEEGSSIFIKFLDLQKSQSGQKKASQSLNEHIKTVKESQKEALKTMEKKYKTIFVNPTDINSQSIVNILIVLKRAFEDRDEEGKEGESSTKSYDRKYDRAIDQRVLNWLIIRLCKPKMKYTLNELVQIIECRHFLSTIKLDLKSLVIEKVQDVRSKICSKDDLQAILQFLPLLEFESISYILEDFLTRAHPKDILLLTQLIERQSMSAEDYESINQEAMHLQPDQSNNDSVYFTPKDKDKRWMPYLTKYFLKLAAAVNYHQKYYSFDQNCYFLYLLLKNEEYWEKQIDYQYLGEIEKLKHSIKIVSYSRGFKLQMGTYFYKLMSYIDVVSFFDGG